MREVTDMALTDPFKDPLGTIRKQPPSVFRRIARWWAVLGSLLVVLAGTMAIAHYGYGVPIYDENTGKVIDPKLAAALIIVLGLGGFLFAVAGTLILRASRTR
ncbi:hypothetical protein [Sphingomonas sp. So64.6b]|uniref:hypothetical protein n=1 Tax=Sphingomonas sp. So64.6b TaxID=2997354 RepID=UPI001AEF0063|nr:hypothetical protein [Sphingomonas sp. So64.6b]